MEFLKVAFGGLFLGLAVIGPPAVLISLGVSLVRQNFQCGTGLDRLMGVAAATLCLAVLTGYAVLVGLVWTGRSAVIVEAF